ncbi:SET domain-containing protein, putative [Cordyceps militaris CM01]|uniref:SET domain-containing protein, putative n=1 Tax=Cordyceps militaris (strain CM01) TaxID=983644 RepID=G3J806_CORMM|nr:SET domain-containing protein, putative [Cordyceps militaris CM01]EGX97217.1 SET domain-containing protein, putative [Cordyceps militaris CM01]
MDTIDSLLQWAADQGVVLDGVRPSRIPGRGLGMVATRHIHKGEVLIAVPTPAIRSRHTLPKSLMGKAPTNMTLHGLLAADLLLHPPDVAAWGTLVPSLADFESSTPFFWPETLQDLLPPEAKKLLRTQQQRFRRDWSHAHAGFPSVAEQDYLYAWFLVGTRSFYYQVDETLPYPWHDRLALLPVADMFNHASVGCAVAFSTEVYDVTADRDYEADEELYTSYGAHSNDFLLAEYGFMLQDNPHDQLCLDAVLLARLSAEHKAALLQRGLLGDWMLRADLGLPSDTVWTAMRGLTGTAAPAWDDWKEGGEDAHGSLAEARAMLPGILAEVRGQVDDYRRRITELRDGANAAKMDVLLQRWNEMDEVARKMME